MSKIFRTPEHATGTVNDPFSKSKITTQLNGRIALTSYPDQDRTSLCGPAAFFYCIQVAMPFAYEKCVWDLWEKGQAKINNLQINIPKQTRQPHSYFKKDGTPKILGIDWMTLGGLRASSNLLLAYQSPDDDASAITTPDELISWLKQAGFKLKETIVMNSIENHKILNGYVKLPNHYIVSLINAGMLPDGSIVGPRLPNHWVVWTSQLTDLKGNLVNESTKPNDIVKLNVFSWGKRYQSIKQISYTQFKLHHTTAFVFIK